MTHFRWVVLGLVFLATTLNYLDRLVMGILAPDLQLRYEISNVQYGYIQSTFAASYAFGQLVSGGVLDRIGTRVGYAVALAAWSFTSMLHAVAQGPLAFGVMRGLLGLSESPAKRAVGLVAGIGGTFGYGGASLFQLLVGYLVIGSPPNYVVPFVCASAAYLIALSAIHLLAPRLTPAIVDR